jgi:hypothetical protein
VHEDKGETAVGRLRAPWGLELSDQALAADDELVVAERSVRRRLERGERLRAV